MGKLTCIAKWRNVIELSSMMNNMESIAYTDEEVQFKKNAHGHLVLSRPVFEEENLDVAYKGAAENEKIGDLTRFIDAYFKMKQDFTLRVGKLGCTPEQALVNYIAYSYYDCMSGGMPGAEAMLARMLAMHPSINKSAEVYPGKGDFDPDVEKGWYTLDDFIKDIGENDRYSKYLPMTGNLPPLLPPPKENA